MRSELFRASLEVTAAFETLGIEHYIGGSVASSLLGERRFTEDVDLVAVLELRHLAPLVETLGGSFYIPRESMEAAVRHRSSFNLIHFESSDKVDVFVLKDDVLSQSSMRRRRRHEIQADPPAAVWLPSPEDVVLQKLRWYRKGGETSERQWRDVAGVLKLQAPVLDREYLGHMGDEIGVGDLLGRALREAGL